MSSSRRNAGHHQAERLFASITGLLADDPAGEHDKNAVRERTDLVQFDGDQENGLAGIPCLDDAPVDEFDRTDIDAARRLPDDQELRVPLDLARDDDLLLVAAGEIRRLHPRIGSSEERRVGKEGVRTCSTRWSPST